MPSIIPQPPAPPASPNLATPIVLDHDTTIAAGQTFYSTTLGTVFSKPGYNDWISLTSGASIWSVVAGDSYLFDVSYFATITNTGLVVANSTGGYARAFSIGANFQGLTNSGSIYAIAPLHGAIAILDYGSGSTQPIANTGLIAAQGLSVRGIWRVNGGSVVNGATGSILAEGDQASAVVIGRGAANGFTITNVDNAGVISATTTGSHASIGVYFEGMAFEAFKVVNSGLIQADYAIYGEDYFAASMEGHEPRDIVINLATGDIEGLIYLGEGLDEIQNSGLIHGDVYMGEDADLFDNAAGVLVGVADMGWGDDRFIGGAGDEVVIGDRGADDLSGGGGFDLLLGGRGDDSLAGGSGADGLYGEAGNDRLLVEGADHVDAGMGDDVVVLQDLTFTLVDGGDGFDTLVLPNTALVLDLQVALASGRVQRFEAISLPGAQELVVRAGDIGAFGSPLVISTTAAGKLDLVGAWTAAGPASLNGVQYQSYQSAGGLVYVEGPGAVAILANAPAGAPGLDSIGVGSAPPLGSGTGAYLSPSTTHAEQAGLTTSLTIDADETWYSNSIVLTGNESGANITNHGLVTTTGAQGASGLSFMSIGEIKNTGTITASTTNDGAQLADNISALRVYGMDTIATSRVSAVAVAVGGLSSSFLNTGTLQAVSGGGVSSGYTTYTNLPGENAGLIAARSTAFIAVAVYLHNGGPFTNSGQIIAEGQLGASGLRSSTHTATITNTGSITATVHGAGVESVGVAFYWSSPESKLINTGTITADVAVQTSVVFNGGGLYLDNSGQIHGRVELNVNPNGIDPAVDVVLNHGLIDGDVHLGGGRDIYYGVGGTQLGAVYGEDGDDWLTGGSGAETLNGGAGNDLIAGGGGGDALTGGAGRDLFRYAAASDSTALATDEILDFETGVDRIDLTGLAPSAVTLNAAGGVTTLEATGASGVLTVHVHGAISMADMLTADAPTIQGTSGVDTLMATAGGSTLIGGAGEDLLIGGAGNDTLQGDDGIDAMWGGTGDDLYIVNYVELPRELPGQGIDTIRTLGEYGWYTLPADIENLEMLAGTTATGNELDNRITGNSGTNTIDGGLGADTMIGGGGNDTYMVDNSGDVVVETPSGSFADLVLTSISYTLGANVENLTLNPHAGSLSATGNELANEIRGNDGDNLIHAGGGGDKIYGDVGYEFFAPTTAADVIYAEGGADLVDGQFGADWISGGDGDDYLYGNSGADVIYGDAGNDHLYGTAPLYFDGISQVYRPTINDDDASDILIAGDGEDYLDGGGGSDVLYGQAGADTLIGGGHADSAPDYLYGGSGDDYYYVNSSLTSALDLVFEGGVNPDLMAGVGDVDTIITQGQFFWDYYSVGEILKIDHAISGGAYLVGGKDVANKAITGSAGTDFISTYGHDSVVDAGAGTDAISFSLYGLDESYRGHNTVVMKAGSGSDYVYEFRSGTDKIDLSAFHFGITGAAVLAQAVNVDNAGTDQDYCYFYLTGAGGVDNFIVFMGLLSNQLQGSDFVI